MNESDIGLNRYLREIGRIPLLTPQQEVELAAKVKKGDAKAREQMINATGEIVDCSGGEAYARIQGETWKVRAPIPLERGELIRVTGIDGLVLAVEPVAKQGEAG